MLERLAVLREEGAPFDALAAAAGAVLTDPAEVAAELARADALADEAHIAFAGLRAIVRSAYSRYPVVRGAGFHGGEPDLRAPQLFTTISRMQRGGLYTWEELEERRAAGTVGEAWFLAEALRLGAFVVTVRALIDALDADSVKPLAYGESVEALAWAFGAIRMASA